MAKLQRKTQKVFCGNAEDAEQMAVFGSMKSGTPDYSSDVEELQSVDYTKGWSKAILSDKAPYLEEMNGVQYGLSYQSAYILQEGIPEYDAGTNYSDTSIVKSVDNDNNIVLYHSLVEDNIGNALSDEDSWQRLYITTVGYIGQPQITFNFGENVLPNDCIWLEGQALSRTLYSKLFAIYGTTYGAGDGSTTFNVPDCRGRVFWGGETAGYVSAGLPNITGSFKVSRWDDRTGGPVSGQSGAFYQYGTATSAHAVVNKEKTNLAGPVTYFAASNSHWIYGNSGTVQPPAIKCRVFTRYQ